MTVKKESSTKTRSVKRKSINAKRFGGVDNAENAGLVVRNFWRAKKEK